MSPAKTEGAVDQQINGTRSEAFGLTVFGIQALFFGGLGRSDFPCGDHVTLIASIQQRLWPMGATTVPIPGQGPERSFAEERHSKLCVHAA
ncbi:hypothetical protein ACVBEH_17260 [Roseateles sp. GG27B]